MAPQSSEPPHLTIGQLAKSAKVNVETIRYYQRIGLLDEPATPAQGFRRYSTDSIRYITFIKRAQGLGFSLKEVAELLQLRDASCHDIRARAEAKRHKIDEQIKHLQALRRTLTQLIDECKSGNEEQACPIVETLLAQDN